MAEVPTGPSRSGLRTLSSRALQALAIKLDKYGAAVVFRFVDPDLLEALLREADSLRSSATRFTEWYNPYNEAGPGVAGASQPRLFRSRFSLEVCDYSRIPVGSLARQLYESEEILALVRAVTGQPELQRYADPDAALNLAFMRSGDTLGWHFDTCDVVVSLLMQAQTEGGALTISRNDRSAHDEHMQHVEDVLSRPSVHTWRIPYAVGSLVIIHGRHSLHRLTDVGGGRDRIALLMSYDAAANSRVTESMRRSRYLTSDGGAE